MAQKKRKRRAVTGQLSIFALLIFQTLFILFAMSLNVALVVHDKINLQNSVDIAAYYGAMKQAEMLNAIAHINYQIRQSWKLLTWRYRVLGSMGLTSIPDASWNHQPRNDDSPWQLPIYQNQQKGPYAFCVGHQYWGQFIPERIQRPGRPNRAPSASDLFCKGMNTTLPAISVPRVGGTVGSLISTFNNIATMATNINTQVKHKCKAYSITSWLLGAMSLLHFRVDTNDRKKMIYKLANKLKDGKDLDNGEITEGVRRTFKKNLSFINNLAFSSDESGSLSQFSPLKDKNPGEWLEDIPFSNPTLSSSAFYTKMEPGASDASAGEDNCSKFLCPIHPSPTQNCHLHDIVTGIYENISPDIAIGSPWPSCINGDGKCESSAGLTKKTDTSGLIFYGVKAELDYKNQIFLPFPLTLKAKAFAKPFGGQIGPADGVDKRLPATAQNNPGTPSSGTIDMAFDLFYAPNYSRYPGDRLGLRSQLVHHYWSRVLQNSPPAEKRIYYYMKENCPSDRDPMARSDTRGDCGGIASTIARQWETAAVAPDLFDITYFTILPYYQWTYFPKIQNLLGNADYIRGDLGTYHESGNTFGGKSVLVQIKGGTAGQNQVGDVWDKLLAQTPPLQKPPYKIGGLSALLTSWTPPTQKYTTDTYNGDTQFGKCTKWIYEIPGLLDVNNQQNTKGKIARGCIFGGRVGYSVKMVSHAFLKRHTDNSGGGVNLPPDWD